MAQSPANPADQRDADAAAWAARIDAARDVDHPDLAQWLTRDRRNSGALLRAQAALALLSEPVRSAETSITPRWAHRRWPAALVAGAAAALVAAMLWPARVSYLTDIGETRSLALSDGSTVSLDALSTASVNIDRTHRQVRLDRGRALFHVVHDLRRPFRVVSGNMVITDVGTTFEVTHEVGADATSILVAEGRVRIDVAGRRIDLRQGQRLRFAQHDSTPTKVESVNPDAIRRALAWREGRMELDGETLADAVVDVNAHSRMPITVMNPALGRQRLYGAFRYDDPEGFARAAALAVNASVRMDGAAIIISASKN